MHHHLSVKDNLQSNYNMGMWISIVYGESKLFN